MTTKKQKIVKTLKAKDLPADFEDVFFNDDIHFHYGSNPDLCSDELSIEYLLIHRIKDVFEQVEALDRYSFYEKPYSEYFRLLTKQKVLKYLLKDIEGNIKTEVEDIERYTKNMKKRKEKL